ncbi:hypothetical protein HHI36_001761 [Cryptolaemus montrouzieri]|uniref:Neurotrophin-3 n=1 Tax=Cryptolaemus montrouzieri TaxID=559131 RepID=A0ABD2P9V3_9CUCU
MIYNLEENNSDLISDRKRHDLEQVGAILSELQIERSAEVQSPRTSVFNAVRVGKATPNRPRPLKVIRSSPLVVKSILKNNIKLKNSPVYSAVSIDGDLTQRQRNQFKNMRSEVNWRRDDGDDVTIRYIRGLPTIVDVKKPKN